MAEEMQDKDLRRDARTASRRLRAPLPGRAAARHGDMTFGLSPWRREALRTTLWVVPLIMLLIAVALFVVTYQIDQHVYRTRTTSSRNSFGYGFDTVTSFQPSPRTRQIGCHLSVQQTHPVGWTLENSCESHMRCSPTSEWRRSPNARGSSCRRPASMRGNEASTHSLN